jgi:hypothetical protein
MFISVIPGLDSALHVILVLQHIAFFGGEIMELILLSGNRLEHALDAANSAIAHGEKIGAKLSSSVELLRGRRDKLAAKLTQARAKEEPLLDEADWLALM